MPEGSVPASLRGQIIPFSGSEFVSYEGIINQDKLFIYLTGHFL